MFRVFVIAVALLGAAACGDAQVEKLGVIRDQVCACKTPACGETAMKQVPQHEIASNHRTQRLAGEMLDCLAKLYAADRPTTDPDAERAEPPAAQASGTEVSAPAP